MENGKRKWKERDKKLLVGNNNPSFLGISTLNSLNHWSMATNSGVHELLVEFKSVLGRPGKEGSISNYLKVANSRLGFGIDEFALRDEVAAQLGSRVRGNGSLGAVGFQAIDFVSSKINVFFIDPV